MTTDTIDRKRSVNVERLTVEQAEQLSDQIGSKINTMVDDTIKKANQLLNIYGLEAKMQIVILKKE